MQAGASSRRMSDPLREAKENVALPEMNMAVDRAPLYKTAILHTGPLLRMVLILHDFVHQNPTEKRKKNYIMVVVG